MNTQKIDSFTVTAAILIWVTSGAEVLPKKCKQVRDWLTRLQAAFDLFRVLTGKAEPEYFSKI